LTNVCVEANHEFRDDKKLRLSGKAEDHFIVQPEHKVASKRANYPVEERKTRGQNLNAE